MNKIEKTLLDQLRRHSTYYIESAERGIVCDDLDVDGFIEETSKLLQSNNSVFGKKLQLHEYGDIKRALIAISAIICAIIVFVLLFRGIIILIHSL